jgi:DNA-binding CsgD family transcriptional regulator
VCVNIADNVPTLGPARNLGLLNQAEQIGGLGSWELTPETTELLWSDNLFRLLGLEPGAIAPSVELALNRVHPDDRERVEDALTAMVAGEFVNLEHRIFRADGAVRYLRVEAEAFPDVGGVPTRIVGAVQDLTLQRRLDRQLAARLAATQALEDWSSGGPGAERLVRRIAVALDVPFGAFWVPAGPALTVREIWHRPLGALAAVIDATRNWHPGLGSHVLGRAFAGREPAILADASVGGSPARSAAIRRAGLSGAMAIPAMAGQETLAVLEFLSFEPIEPAEPLLRALRGIGHEIGHFLSRRRGELTGAVLTPRELDVLQLAAYGRSTTAIAAELYLSPATVKRHFERAYARLAVSDRVAAVGEAMRRGLIT